MSNEYVVMPQSAGNIIGGKATSKWTKRQGRRKKAQKEEKKADTDKGSLIDIRV
ncbi:MAG: hypothetical protein L7F77_09930 [Candidatus Magnetominusculus sp. LBB02]|nr:hypothetical protein [Candidatus Magnetominusculus sp. LBB02]